METGQRRGSVRSIGRLAEALGVDVTDIASFDARLDGVPVEVDRRELGGAERSGAGR